MSDLPRISPAEAHAKMNDEGFTYVDVRTEEEFVAGHPERAVNVPWLVPGAPGPAGAAGMVPNPEFLSIMERAFAKDAPVIVGCKAGARSARAAQALVDAGFSRVVDQRAGWDGVRGAFGELTEPGWSRAALPIAAGAATPSLRK
jgi:rhodanese-related sulfurtransferase